MIDRQTNVTIATYCSLGEAQVRLTVKCPVGDDPAKYLDPVEAEIRERLGKYIYAIGETDMPHVVVGLLRRAGRSAAVAESCTGGKIADWLVDVPGVSEVLIEGHVTYSNISKERTLGVRHDTLEKYTAVSEQVAREMAEGLHELSGADYCLSVTGIAGPGGGTPETPVGLVYIGLKTPRGTQVEKFNFTGDRYRVRSLAALRALNMLRKALTDIDEVTISD